jgi:integrase
MKLTDIQVRNTKPGAGDYKLTDGHGLYLLVRVNGSKLWRGRYEINGKEKLMSYGVYPEVTITAARDMHDQTRKDLAKGLDPMQERKAREEKEREENQAVADPFRDVANQWYNWWKTGKDGRYATNVRSRLDSDILPALGDLSTMAITPAHVTQMVLNIEKRGACDVARRALQTADQIYRFAIPRNLATYNPASTFKPKDILKPMVRENFKRLAPSEFPKLLKKIQFYNGSPVTKLCMRLMALVFLRTSELIEGRWSEIDWKGTRWDIPKERMKGPEAKKRPHTVPLSRQAIAVLKELWEYRKNNRWMFPGEQGAAHISNNTILHALEKMGYKGEMTGHGFRGIASTYLHEAGYEDDWIELQLHHVPENEVKSAYNHAKYLTQRRKMMQDWADHLDALLAEALKAP